MEIFADIAFILQSNRKANAAFRQAITSYFNYLRKMAMPGAVPRDKPNERNRCLLVTEPEPISTSTKIK
jgi:hypothetical protein